MFRRSFLTLLALVFGILPASCSPHLVVPTPAIAVETAAKATGDATPDINPDNPMPQGETEVVTDWWGVIHRTGPGAQYDDYFERQDFGQLLYFGIDSRDPAVEAQIEAMRDSGKIVHLYGTLHNEVPDYNGSQIQVDRIETED